MHACRHCLEPAKPVSLAILHNSTHLLHPQLIRQRYKTPFGNVRSELSRQIIERIHTEAAHVMEHDVSRPQLTSLVLLV